MPQIGFFELYPSAKPALPAGAYLLAADHDLVATPPNNADGELAVDGSDFTFKIISPRYTMPPDQILSTFPPAAAVGDWHQRLPQIVFKRRTLPWERNPDPTQPFDKAPPWLALVVLAEGEGSLSGDVPISECSTPGTKMDQTDNDTSTGRYLQVRDSIVKTIFPTVEDLNLLTHVRKVNLDDTELALGDDDGYLAVVVANRLPQPGPPSGPGGPPTSVKYTAHLVNLEGQLGALPTKEESPTDFNFVLSMPELVQTELYAGPPPVAGDIVVMQGINKAVFGQGIGGAGAAGPVEHAVAAGRVERSTGVEAAAAAYAVGPVTKSAKSSDDTKAVQKWQDGTFLGELAELHDVIRLVPVEPTFRFPVLVSWDFVCAGSGTFEQLMEALDTGMLGTAPETGDPALSPEIAVTGHITLDHRTRRGEAASSWYRGPFVPQPTERIKPAPDGTLPLAHTGDQLRRVVPDGHEDIGTAAAFEIGRLLALSKPGVVASMMSWREELFGAARVHQLGLGFFEEIVAGFAASALAGKRTLQDLVAGQVMLSYSANAPSVVGPAVKSFASSRPPDVLDATSPDDVLAGLGLDPGQVHETTKQFGLAGLGRLDVTVAEASNKPLSSMPDELRRVAGRLSAHVDSIAADALGIGTPAIGAPKPGGAAAPARAPRRRRDTLDRLLADATRTHNEEGRR